MIRRLREERGWIQLELAYRLGVTPVTIYNLGARPDRAAGLAVPPAHSLEDRDAAPSGDAALFRAAFPEGERKQRAPGGAAARDGGGTP